MELLNSSGNNIVHLHDHLTHPIFKVVSEVADEMGLRTYVIGGYVRDLMLERPCKDIDFVVVGSGMAVAEKAAEKLGGLKVAVFKNFGTANFNYEGYEIEFVGARKESYQRHSRKPIVEDGSLQDDQNRRDFTINAMAISMNGEDFGQLVDPFNGIEGLQQGMIKTPLDPDITYSDDPLRMMRAIRFSSQLDFQIETESLAAIERNKERLDIVSKERITDELNKIILSPRPSKGFRLLFKTGLLERFFPEMVALHGVDVVDGKRHKDNFYHTLQVLDNISVHTNDLWLRWAAILHDIAKPATKRFSPEHGWTFHGHEDRGAKMVPRIFRQLRLPLDQKMKFVKKMVALHLRPIALSKEEATDSAVRRLIFEAGDDIEALMTLCEADITSKNEAKVKRFLKNFEKVRARIKEVEENDRIRNWQPPISGDVIIRTFDMKPDKKIGIIKSAIKDAILDGEIANNYEEAYAFMLRKGKELGLEPV